MRLIDVDKVIEQERYYAEKYKGDFVEIAAVHFIKILDSAPTVDAIPIKFIQKEIEGLEESLNYYGSIGEYDALRIDAMYRHDALTGLLWRWKAERKDNG